MPVTPQTTQLVIEIGYIQRTEPDSCALLYCVAQHNVPCKTRVLGKRIVGKLVCNPILAEK